MSMDENAIRAVWKTGANCQIYSNSKKKWFHGEVAQIFTDEEGEWLEVRYDKSMSKQVQRYSSDIRPHPDDLKSRKKKAKPKASSDPTSPFADPEMKNGEFTEKERQVRQVWGKGDEVEIFSNTHQEWYLGEVVDIIKDDEGEWLTCVWARANNEAMSKQVQRFSTDVRPVQDDSSTGSEDSDDSEASPITSKSKSEADKKRQLATQIASRKSNFRRRAPPFSRTLRPSTFTYPASKIARQTRKLNDLEEALEKYQHVVENMPGSHNKHKRGWKRVEIESLEGTQVRDFIRSLGVAYDRYGKKFRNVKGRALLSFNEASLHKMGISAKLHRSKILLEIARHAPHPLDIFSHGSEVLDWTPMQVEEWCKSQQLLALYAKKFYNHGIDGMLLFEMDAKDLSTIGVKKMHQARIVELIESFGNKMFPTHDEQESKVDEHDQIVSLGDVMSGGGADKNPGKKNRGSVAHIDVSALNGSALDVVGVVAVDDGVQNNDAIIYTMGELLLELGRMFKVGKVQDLTTRLSRQLNELQRNSVHPQMLKRQSIEEKNGSVDLGDGGKAMMRKMTEKVDTPPSGVDAAWIKTQSQAKGHKRRSSLPYINANQLDNDDEEEDDISDIE